MKISSFALWTEVEKEQEMHCQNIIIKTTYLKGPSTHPYLADQEIKIDNSSENMFNSSRGNENIIFTW